jgi:hypothetical protein
MAVEPEFLERPVRCPNCGGLVVATAAALAVKGGAPPGDVASEPRPESDARRGVPTFPHPPEDGSEPAGDWNSAGAATAVEGEPAALAAETAFPPGRRRPAPARRTGAYLLAFLIPYGIAATIAAAYFFQKSRQAVHPLEMLPDWPAEHPGVTRKERTGPVSEVYERWRVDTPLPARLRVGLGRTVRVGALEVTPTQVERRRLLLVQPPGEPFLSAAEALVLTLRLRNVSADQSFCPLDPAFDARWTEGKSKPYTYLAIGSREFYGGPVAWERAAPRNGGAGRHRTYLDGRSGDDRPLEPGEERTTVVCTSSDDAELADLAQRHRGPLLWRVRLRRGLVTVAGREVSATAVIGVEFSPDAIRHVGPDSVAASVATASRLRGAPPPQTAAGPTVSRTPCRRASPPA